MFIKNKYTNWYTSLIERAVLRSAAAERLPADGMEKHHIIPNSFYLNCSGRSKIGWLPGNPDDPSNLVLLTIREHRLCHILLTKMTTGPAYHKMIKAAKFLIDTRARLYGLSKGKCYEKIKAASAACIRVVTDETRVKLSASNTGKKHSAEWTENNRQAQLRRAPTSPETKEKIKQSMIGRVMSDEWKQKIGDAHKGRVFSEETLIKMRTSALNRALPSDETKEKIRKAGTGRKHSAESIEKMRKVQSERPPRSKKKG